MIAGKTILVVDDEAEFLMLISTLLEAEGYRVITCENGLQGLKLARAHRPDLILSDINMPEVSGLEMLQALRQEPDTTLIPLILVTANKELPQIREGMSLGADDYLTKPFRADDLIASVRARMEKQQLTRQQYEARLNELRVQVSRVLPHELRTPLHHIHGFAEVLTGGAENMSADDIRNIAGFIVEGAEDLQRIIERYHLYTELQVRAFEKAQPTDEEVDLGLILPAVAQSVAKEFGRLEDLELHAESQQAAIDEVHAQRLIQELVNNAFKFSQPGKPVAVTLAPNERSVSLVVNDEGVGMVPPSLSEIGAFQQQDRQRREQQGLGLGLAIAALIVRTHKGDLRIESEPGSGATVYATLPR